MDNQTLLFVVVAMDGVILISLCTLFYQLLRQQGRILLRLDDAEQNTRVGFEVTGEYAEIEPTGLNVGAQFPSFRFSDLAGRVVGLKDFEGKRVLLVHWSAECGFCAAIGKDLALLEEAFIKARAQLLLLSSDDASTNEQQAKHLGLNYPILLAKDGSEALELFNDFGTPAAYLLDDQARVAHPLVVGSEGVLSLARQVAAGVARKPLPRQRALSESRIERRGLRAGTRAPVFSLPDLSGHTVSLEDYRGRKLLLVFTDPHCEPCDRIAPELARLHKQPVANGLTLVIVGRGDPEENRKKARQNGFDFPVVLQKRWELSKQYGIFATPVAFLIDEEGVIARDVAAGADAILELARNALPKVMHHKFEEPVSVAKST